MKRLISICLATALMVSVLGGCGQKKTDELVLGLVGPMTGASAASGIVQANAVKMAVDEINAAGGIDGKIKIKLVSEDDEGVPAKSVTVTQKLVSQDKINVMIGALNSSCTLADMKITQKASIPQVTAASSAASIVQQNNPFIFRTTATDSKHVETLYKYVKQNLKGSKVAVLYESSDFGTNAYKLLAAAAPDAGINIADAEVYNSGDKDFSIQLTKMKAIKPDAIIIWGYYTEAALICKQVKQYGITIPLIGTGYNSPKLTELGGDAVNNLIFTTSFTSANPDAKVQAFDQKYKKLYNQGYDQNAPQAYDTVYIIADAVKRAGSLDGQKIRDAIAATKDYNGITGVTNFQSNGDMVRDLLVVKIVDGKHTIVPMS